VLIYSFIPARKGSKRIPNKNVKKLNGIPLINYTINHCLKSKFINKTFISSNDNKLLSLIKGKNIYKIKRPNILSGDASSTEDAVLHFIKYLNKEKITLPDLIILLQCTSPKRHAHDIDNAINLFKKKNMILYSRLV
jgi:CMP-N-acetylneuraminic acid synthetase